MPHILVVEDELDLAELITYHLKKNDYDVTEAHDGRKALDYCAVNNYDLIILDLMLPEVDGMAVFSALKGEIRTQNIPVIMLTAKGQPTDRIAGLEAGADDYLTKPFVPKELILRVQKQLKTVAKTRGNHTFKIDNLTFDVVNQSLSVDDQVSDLTSTEFKLLLFLCKHPNQVQSRATLLQEVWGYSESTHSRTLDTHMKRIRQKLLGASETIQTVRGKGYMYEAQS